MTQIISVPQAPRKKKPVRKPRPLRLRAGTKELIELFESNGYDPAVFMMQIAQNAEYDIELRAHMHKELLSYMRPKLKAVSHDITARADVEFRMILERS